MSQSTSVTTTSSAQPHATLHRDPRSVPHASPAPAPAPAQQAAVDGSPDNRRFSTLVDAKEIVLQLLPAAPSNAQVRHEKLQLLRTISKMVRESSVATHIAASACSSPAETWHGTGDGDRGDSNGKVEAFLSSLPFWLLDTHSFSLVLCELARWLPDDRSLQYVVDLQNVRCGSGISLRGSTVRLGENGFIIGIRAKDSLVRTASTEGHAGHATGKAPGAAALIRYRWWKPDLLYQSGPTSNVGTNITAYCLEAELCDDLPSGVFYAT